MLHFVGSLITQYVKLRKPWEAMHYCFFSNFSMIKTLKLLLQNFNIFPRWMEYWMRTNRRREKKSICQTSLYNRDFLIRIFVPLIWSKSLNIEYLLIFLIWYLYFPSVAHFKIYFICVHPPTHTYIHIQCPPLILAPLVNMSKGGCENKSALFILFIFHSKNSQNSNLSLK